MASRDDYNSGWQLTFEQVTKNYFKEKRRRRLKEKKFVQKSQYLYDSDSRALAVASESGFKIKRYGNCY